MSMFLTLFLQGGSAPPAYTIHFSLTIYELQNFF